MFSIFKKGSPASAAEIEVALAEIDISALEAAHTTAVEARAALLLTGSDKEVLAAEAEIDRARLAVDRVKAVQGELERRLVAAKADEAKAALDAELAAAAAEADAVKRALATEWPKHAKALIGLLERLHAAEKAIGAINTKLIAADRADDRLREVERDLFDPGGKAYLPSVSIRNRSSLPNVFDAGSWPPADR